MRGLIGYKIAVIGLGYVGLPLAVEFGKRYNTVGFDIKEARVAELKSGHDSTLEADSAELKSAKKLSYTHRAEDIAGCNFMVVDGALVAPADVAACPGALVAVGFFEVGVEPQRRFVVLLRFGYSPRLEQGACAVRA